MTPTLLEFNYQRLTKIRSRILEDSILMSMFRQEYPDIPEIERAYWDMRSVDNYLDIIIEKIDEKLKAERE